MIAFALTTLLLCPPDLQDLEDTSLVEGYADSSGVRIHYVTKGKGPLLVMIHGFPDYWYTWRNQMEPLSKNFRVVAIDQRGYNKSGQPEGVDAYRMQHLVADVAAVIRHLGEEKAVICGHDWGGAVAWAFAMMQPAMTERLIVLNTPHPAGMSRELASNPEQQENSQYARDFQAPDAASKLEPEGLVGWVKDAEARALYVEAMRRSSMEGMLNYYKANYPKGDASAPARQFPKIRCPVLAFHGVKDKYLLAAGWNGTWEWCANEFTLVTIPDAGHFVQHDAPELVTKRMVAWLAN